MNRFRDRYLPYYAPPDEGGTGGGVTDAPVSDAPVVGADVVDDTTGTEFSGMGALDDDIEELPAEPPIVKPDAAPAAPAAAAPAAPKVPAPAAPAAPAPAAPAKPVVAATPAPQPGQQEAPPAAAPASAAPDDSPVGLIAQIDQHRDAMLDALAAGDFALTKEEAEALELDVVKALPRLGAKVYYQAVKTTLNHIQNHVPRIIQQYLAADTRRRETEDAFYGANKALDKTKHHGDVVAFATAFRAANPNMTQADLWSMAASAVMAKHGLSAAPTGNGGAPPAPRPSATPSFVPARPGVAVSVAPEADNEFAGLGMEHEDE